MSDNGSTAQPIVGHGSSRLPAVDVDSYNVEIKDDEGFIGDRANKAAFRAILDESRKRAREGGKDPFGDEDTDDIPRKKLDDIVNDDDGEARRVVERAIDEFAKELARVVRRFLRLKAWKDTQRLVFGGGFPDSRVGELAIGRAGALLRADDFDIEVTSIRHDPDEAGLIGSAHLAPSWIFKGHDAILAADIGGTNIRTGIVELNLKRAKDLSKAAVWKSELWRHADSKINRDTFVKRLIDMFGDLIDRAGKEKLKLAPFIGVGCPGLVEPDGTVQRGTQNLPGNWDGFDLPATLREAIPNILKEETHIVMHNDAVVQGLSQVPFMQDIERWGVFTIGTGLGNARFTNRTHDE